MSSASEDIGGPPVGGQKVGAVFCAEEIGQGGDTGQQAHQVIFLAAIDLGRCEHRLDQVMAHAFLAHLHLQPIGEEINIASRLRIVM